MTRKEIFEQIQALYAYYSQRAQELERELHYLESSYDSTTYWHYLGTYQSICTFTNILQDLLEKIAVG